MIRIFSTLLFAAWALAASAHDYQAGKIFIAHPWSRPTAPGVPMGVAYFTLENRGTTEDVLVSASTPAAARVEFHQTTLSEGIARMRALTQVALPPGKSVKVEPGGIHLMLVGLKQALQAGTRVPLTLQFRDAGSIEVLLHIEARDVGGLEDDSTSPRAGRPRWARYSGLQYNTLDHGNEGRSYKAEVSFAL